MPIACGVIDEDAVTRELALEPVNDSVIAGTARLALSGSRLYAWVSLGGYIEGRQHMQHIHVPEGNSRGSCPTPELDSDHDGLISLEEGVPAYGAPAVSLEPFPAPTDVSFEYSHSLHVPAGFALDRAVVVVHGMDVAGKYDETIPVACGAVDPNAPGCRLIDVRRGLRWLGLQLRIAMTWPRPDHPWVRAAGEPPIDYRRGHLRLDLRPGGRAGDRVGRRLGAGDARRRGGARGCAGRRGRDLGRGGRGGGAGVRGRVRPVGRA